VFATIEAIALKAAAISGSTLAVRLLGDDMALVSEAQPIAAWMAVQCRTRPGAATTNFLRGVLISRKKILAMNP
jgi:hypothetical protein